MKGDFQSWEEAVLWLINQDEQKDLVEACYYDQPLSAAAQRYFLSDEWQEVSNLLSELPRGSVLDIGAGQGISSYALARDGWKVSSLEPDSSHIVGAGAIRALASTECLDITVYEGVGEGIPFEDNEFDLIFTRQVLHHADDLTGFCREIYRVLKPGGVFIALRDHVISRDSDLSDFFEIHPLHNLYGGENAYRLKQYKKAIVDSGMVISKVLGPLDSVINYAPYTEKSLWQEIYKRLNKFVPSIFLSWFGKTSTRRSIVLKMLSLFDNRPGRLYSFLCVKPGSHS